MILYRMSTGQAVGVLLLGEILAAEMIYMHNRAKQSQEHGLSSILLDVFYVLVPFVLGGIVYFFEMGTLGTVFIVIETMFLVVFSFIVWMMMISRGPGFQ